MLEFGHQPKKTRTGSSNRSRSHADNHALVSSNSGSTTSGSTRLLAMRQTPKNFRSPLKRLLSGLFGDKSRSTRREALQQRSQPQSGNPSHPPMDNPNTPNQPKHPPRPKHPPQPKHPNAKSGNSQFASPKPASAKSPASAATRLTTAPVPVFKPAKNPTKNSATVTPFRTRQPKVSPAKAMQREARGQSDAAISESLDSHGTNAPSNVVPLSGRRHPQNNSPAHRSSKSPAQPSMQHSIQTPTQDPTQNPTQKKSPNQSESSSPQRGDSREHRVRRPPQPQLPTRPVSPLVYVMRLLIIGVGVGAIAGTTLSLLEPTMRTRPPARNTPAVNLAGTGSESWLRNSQTVILTANREMTPLSTKLATIARGYSGELIPGVFVADLTSGEYATLNGGNVFSSASMIKVPILIAFFQAVDAGNIRLDEILTIQQDDVAEGSGDMQHLPLGTQYSALETATQMIVNSDNTATNMIVRRLGGIEKLNQRFKQWGLQQTLIRDHLPDLNGTNTTSPKELVSLLGTVTQGGLLSMISRDRVISIMRGTLNNALLPETLGEGSLIAHKTGDIGSMLGDTGIVDLPSGKRYLIAVMVKRPVNDERAYEVIHQLGAGVYQHFAPVKAASPTQSSPATSPTPGSAQ